MIITELGGGLGNQMFQYALGKKLAVKNNDELKIDTTTFNKHTDDAYYRAFGLHHFNISAKHATQEDIRRVKYPFGKFWYKIKNKFERKILHYNRIKFEPHMLRKSGNIFLEGYWQSEKYFKDVRPIILNEFSLKDPYSTGAQAICDDIQAQKNTVSLHVRRGDYVASEENRRKYGAHCNQEYYERGLAFFAEKLGDLSVFVFSDDIEWVKQNISIPHKTTYISEHAAPDYERLMLMSVCEHHILANSTFGWWSAWLNDKPGKVVVAPALWIVGPNLPIDDILPPEWVRL